MYRSLYFDHTDKRQALHRDCCILYGEMRKHLDDWGGSFALSSEGFPSFSSQETDTWYI